MIRFRSLALSTLFAMGALPALAQSPVTLSGAWVREPVPGRAMTAAYAVVENPGASAITIVGASSDAAGTVEIHEMVREGDAMKMQPVPNVIVPAGGTLELKPGSYHLMLFNLTRPLKVGDTVQITLTTSTGGSVKTAAAVKKGSM